MAVLTHPHKTNQLLISLDNLQARTIRKIHMTRCLTAALGLLLSGLLIPWLMVLQALPLTLLWGFTCLALIGSGSVLALCYCGDK